MLDEELARDVRDELVWDDAVDSAGIEVTVEGAVVVLTGVVHTVAERWSAGQAAGRIAGVRGVRNMIVVDDAAERILDAQLTAEAIAGLDANELVPPGAVRVRSSDGWVTMTGDVAYYVQRQAAESVVRHLPGLRGFTNLIRFPQNPDEGVAETG